MLSRRFSQFIVPVEPSVAEENNWENRQHVKYSGTWKVTVSFRVNVMRTEFDPQPWKHPLTKLLPLFFFQQKAKEATETTDEQQAEAADSGLWRGRRHVVNFLDCLDFLFTMTDRHLSYSRKQYVSAETHGCQGCCETQFKPRRRIQLEDYSDLKWKTSRHWKKKICLQPWRSSFFILLSQKPSCIVCLLLLGSLPFTTRYYILYFPSKPPTGSPSNEKSARKKHKYLFSPFVTAEQNHTFPSAILSSQKTK